MVTAGAGIAIIVAALTGSTETVGIIALCPEEPASRRALATLRDDFATRGVRGVTVSQWPGDHCGQAPRRPVADRLARAKRLFARMKMEEAEHELRGLTEDLLDDPAQPNAAALLLEAYAYLGWLSLQLGRHQEAEEHFGSALRLNPQWSPPRSVFPPAVADAVAQASQRLVGKPTANLEVETRPSGAEIALDDRLTCTSPCTLEVPVGRHLLAVSRPDAIPTTIVVAVASASKRVTIPLEPDPIVALERLQRDPDGPLPGPLRDFPHHTALVVVPPRGRRAAASVYVVQNGPPRTVSVTTAAALSRSRDAIAARVEPTPPPLEPVPEKARWVWPVIGMATSALTFGVLLVWKPDIEVTTRP